jgi:hypothetical protein
MQPRSCYIALLLAFLSSAGCASIVGYNRLYLGPPLPREQVAVLTQRNPYLQDLIVNTVDGISAALAGVVELAPGHHAVCAGYADGHTHSRGCSTVEIDVQAGHTYELYRIHQTHKPTWRLALWDVTDELSRPEKRELAEKIVAIVNNNRPNSATHFAAPESTPSAAPLAGFDEERTATISGSKGEAVLVRYSFDRYTPFLRVSGSDGKEYHIEISQQNGEVVRVFGTSATVGSFWSSDGIAFGAFQPLGSEYALLIDEDSRVVGAYREAPPGTYSKVENLEAVTLPAVP